MLFHDSVSQGTLTCTGWELPFWSHTRASLRASGAETSKHRSASYLLPQDSHSIPKADFNSWDSEVLSKLPSGTLGPHSRRGSTTPCTHCHTACQGEGFTLSSQWLTNTGLQRMQIKKKKQKINKTYFLSELFVLSFRGMRFHPVL